MFIQCDLTSRAWICWCKTKGWITHRFSYAMHHNDVNNMIPAPSSPPPPPEPLVSATFPDFWQNREPVWRNYLIWTVDWSGAYNTPGTQNTLTFLSVIAAMQGIFQIVDSSWFIFYCRSSFHCKASCFHWYVFIVHVFISKYWISVNKDILKPICKCAVS